MKYIWLSILTVMTLGIQFSYGTHAQAPRGASIVPPSHGQFPCIKEQEATIEVWDT